MSETRTPEDSASDTELVMDHEYDGIQEYDNPMPAWWKALFLGTVLFSLGYLFWYHVSGRGASVAAEFQAEVETANALRAGQALREQVSESSLEQLMVDSSMMQKAAELFDQKCKACHAEKGQGNIGPNLTDNYWIHGRGKLMDIYGVVSNGSVLKGMPAWSQQLTPGELRQLVAFVATLRGKNVAGKAPEGSEVPAP